MKLRRLPDCFEVSFLEFGAVTVAFSGPYCLVWRTLKIELMLLILDQPISCTAAHVETLGKKSVCSGMKSGGLSYRIS